MDYCLSKFGHFRSVSYQWSYLYKFRQRCGNISASTCLNADKALQRICQNSDIAKVKAANGLTCPNSDKSVVLTVLLLVQIRTKMWWIVVVMD